MFARVSVPVSSSMLERVVRLLGSHRYRWRREDDLQHSLHGVLVKAGVDVTREFKLTADERVDLWVPHGEIAVEVKVAQGVAPVTRQLARYAATGVPRELLLVTTRATHQAVPRFFEGPDRLVQCRVLFLPTVA